MANPGVMSSTSAVLASSQAVAAGSIDCNAAPSTSAKLTDSRNFWGSQPLRVDAKGIGHHVVRTHRAASLTRRPELVIAERLP